MLTLSQIQASAEAGQLRVSSHQDRAAAAQASAYLKGIADLCAFLQDESDVRSNQMRIFVENTRIFYSGREQT